MNLYHNKEPCLCASIYTWNICKTLRQHKRGCCCCCYWCYWCYFCFWQKLTKIVHIVFHLQERRGEPSVRFDNNTQSINVRIIYQWILYKFARGRWEGLREFHNEKKQKWFYYISSNAHYITLYTMVRLLKIQYSYH